MPTNYNFSDIFISYSHKDTAFVRQLSDWLTARGYEVWVDWEDIPKTVDWWREIQAGINAANIFIFVLSPRSAVSEVCYDEVQHATEQHKRIIPVLYETITDSKVLDELHPSIRSHNWLIFNHDAFEASAQEIMHSIMVDIEYVNRHTRYLVRALEWDNRHRDASFLLRGVDAREAALWLLSAEDKDPEPIEIQRAYVEASLDLHYRESAEKAVLDFILRMTPVFVGAAGAMLFYTLATFRASGFLILNQQYLSSAISISVVFGAFTMLLVLVVDPTPSQTPTPRMLAMRVLRSVFGVAMGAAAWYLYTWVGLFQQPELNTMLAGGAGLAGGFILHQFLPLKNWQAILVTTIMTYLPIWFTNQFQAQLEIAPLLYFDDPAMVYTIGLPFALIVAVGGHAFPIISSARKWWASLRDNSRTATRLFDDKRTQIPA